MLKRRYFGFVFSLVLVSVTFIVCEAGFRAFDYFTTPRDLTNQDEWVKKVSRELEEHPLLGYRRVPNQVITHNNVFGEWLVLDGSAVDKFGMLNAREALAWDRVDVVGVGDSYIDIAHRVFFERFKAEGIKYHSLALFGYGPAQYNVLMKEYGPELGPKLYVYSTYLGNDPGDVWHYERWRASGQGWYEHNGGYAFSIERQGFVWGWRLFIARAKGFVRGLISRLNPDSYGAVRKLIKRDDAETVFEYILQAKDLASTQGAAFLVVIIPRTPEHKPLLDPLAANLISLCTAKQIDCFDLDPAFGAVNGREKLFLPDGHWNEAGMHAAWTYLWNAKVHSVVPDRVKPLSPEPTGGLSSAPLERKKNLQQTGS